MKNSDKKYRQGRSKRQWESNETNSMIAFTILVFVLLGMMVYNIIK